MTSPAQEEMSCLECANCIFSPSSGVYCREWSEIVPLTFAQECPAWTPK